MQQTTPISRRRAGVTLAAFLLCSACGSSEPAPAPEETDDVNAFMTHYFEVFDSYVTDDIMALFATDVTAEITGLGMLQGADAVRDDWLIPFTSAFPDYSHSVNEITVDGTQATVDFVFTGTHQGPLNGYEPTGKELVLPIMGTYDVENSLVTSFKLEYELTILLAAITP